MNELPPDDAVFGLPFPFEFPPMTEDQDTCEFLLPHLFNELLAGTRTGFLLFGTSFSSGTVSTLVIPGPWNGGEAREGGVTVGMSGAPKVYARSRFVIVIFGNVGEGCRT